MARTKICELNCLSCPYSDCIGGDRPPRAEYFKQYYQNFTEEQKQRNRERALAWYRKNSDRINEAKREKRRLNRAEH